MNKTTLPSEASARMDHKAASSKRPSHSKTYDEEATQKSEQSDTSSQKFQIVFFGTDKTSLDALKALTEQFAIEAIITKPDSKNSSAKPTPSHISNYAVNHRIPCYKPINKAELSQLFRAQQFQSQLGVVLDYGIIIPEDVINSFELQIINSHFSLLPQYRGADPIRSAILNGDTTTGVTIMKIVPELDAGPILTWSELIIEPTLNAIDLRTKLSELNCSLLPETIKMYVNGVVEPVSQDDSTATFTSKVEKQDGILNPSKLPAQLEREVRAYVGWPKSYFEWQNRQVVITEAKVSDIEAKFGTLSVVDKKLYFGATAGSLEIQKIQPAGKPVMDAQSFINGYKNLF